MEGDKPGPCPEHHAEEHHSAEHGVGGKSHPEDVKDTDKRAAFGRSKAAHGSEHQHQVHADVQHIVGTTPAYSGGGGSNDREHGKAGTMLTGVTLDQADPDTAKKLKKLREYADANGVAINVFSTIPGFTSVHMHAPKAPLNDRQKDIMWMRNSAVVSDDAALHPLADKLEEMGAPIAKRLSPLVAEGKYEEARTRIKEHEQAYGSILSKGGKLGQGGRSGTLTESVERRCECKRKPGRKQCRWTCTEEYSDDGFHVDREAGVIYNVLILGRKSKNKRRYTQEAMEDAVRRRKYENLQVYIGPHKRSKWAKRSPNDHAGELFNTRVTRDGIRGNLRYNRASQGGQLVLEIAERFPHAFGFSHHADIAGYEEDGEKVVTRILEVAVADVVKDPGTTETVFEEVDHEIPAENQEEQYDAEDGEEGGGWEECLKKLVAEIHDDDSVDDDKKMKATKTLLKLKKELKGEDEEEDAEEEADEEEDDEEGEEEVDPKKLKKRSEPSIARAVDRAVKQALKRHLPKARPPKSSARSEVTEDVNPKPKDKPKPKHPTKREDILAAYEAEEDEEEGKD